MSRPRILVIKLGALGDFIYALGPMQAVRRHHAEAELVLLTRPAYGELAERSGLFDQVWFDPKPGLFDVSGALALRARLRGGAFSRIYDLQTSDRTNWYRQFMRPGPLPEWSGIARGASHRHVYDRPTMTHHIDRHREQLRIAGIDKVELSDLSFMDGEIDRFALPEQFALLVPGSSKRMAVKRWPAERYAEIARGLADQSITPVLLGGAEEADAIEIVRQGCEGAMDLSGQTTIFDIPALGRRAVVAVGNDTGPIHMIAFSGCPTVAVFSAGSFPEKAGPRGEHVRVISRDRLQDLTVDEVREEMHAVAALDASTP
jgi:ADP-heptose:LPS heptosyltransferase